jgi:hypothetical protein
VRAPGLDKKPGATRVPAPPTPERTAPLTELEQPGFDRRLGGHPSPEARSAVAAFRTAAPDLGSALADSASGRERAARGHAPDLRLAAALDASRVVPVLVDGVFAELDRRPRDRRERG